MRVIAGIARGRRLQAPPGMQVRPTSDRVKEALFSSLMPHLPGADVLDLFAGSGALGIEALSRGAAHATFVEQSPRTAEVLRANLDTTGLASQADVVVTTAAAFLRTPPIRPGSGHTLALLDPPYDLAEDDLAALLASLVDHLDPADAVVVVERDAASPTPAWPGALRAVRDRTYGSTRLHVAERVAEDRAEPQGEP